MSGRKRQDRNIIVTGNNAGDALRSREVQDLRSETENIRLELEDIEIQDVVPVVEEATVTEPVFTGGGGGLVVGTVSSFDPVSQVAQVTVPGLGTLPMDNHATFQLVPGDIVTCGQDISGTVYYIIGLIRPPDYTPPSWAVPTIPSGFPISSSGLAIPFTIASNSSSPSYLYNNFNSNEWITDDADVLGFGAGSLVSACTYPYGGILVISADFSGITHIPPYATSTNNASYYGQDSTPTIFAGKVFQTEARSNNVQVTQYFDPTTMSWSGTSWAGTLVISLYSTVANGKLWLLRHTFSNTAAPSIYVVNNDLTVSDVTENSSADPWGLSGLHYNAGIKAGGGYVWYGYGKPRVREDTNTTGSGKRTPNNVGFSDTTASVDDDGNLWTVQLASNGTLSKVSPLGTNPVTVWTNLFDPAAPVARIGGVHYANNSIYIAGNLLAEHVDPVYSGTGYYMPAIWQVSDTGSGWETSRIWTGTTHVGAAIGDVTASGLYYYDSTTLRWSVGVRESTAPAGSADGSYLYQAII